MTDHATTTAFRYQKVDAFTADGSAGNPAACLCLGLWDGTPGRVEQGGADRVFNAVHLTAPDGVVQFGGSATVRIDGVYLA